jgi:DNA-binding transcriptional MerR regulator
MLTMGEFSAATRLTVKALRMYHEEGIIVPERTDPITGYRYYGDSSWRRAEAVKLLREIGFSHRELKEILSECSDDDDLGAFFSKRLEAVDRELDRMRGARERIAYYLERGKDTDMKRNAEITIKDSGEMSVCSIRYTGRYDEIGTRFQELFKKAGRYACGAAMALYHDIDYKEGDADIEAALPVRKAVSIPGVVCRKLPAEKLLSAFHYGPYETLHETYRAAYEAVKERDLEIHAPCREIYQKGPGMFFHRDPKKFVTELLIPVRLAKA